MAAEPHIEAVVDRVVTIVARNEKLLTTMAKTGIVGDVIQLLSAILPIATVVWKAHGVGGHGHQPAGEIDAGRYPAYTG